MAHAIPFARMESKQGKEWNGIGFSKDSSSRAKMSSKKNDHASKASLANLKKEERRTICALLFVNQSSHHEKISAKKQSFPPNSSFIIHHS